MYLRVDRELVDLVGEQFDFYDELVGDCGLVGVLLLLHLPWIRYLLCF